MKFVCIAVLRMQEYFVDSPESTCFSNRSQFKKTRLFKQSGPVFHVFRYVHWNDFVVVNCYCLLTVLERSLKILKVLCEMDVIQIRNIWEHHRRPTHAQCLQQAVLTFPVLCAQPLWSLNFPVLTPFAGNSILWS